MAYLTVAEARQTGRARANREFGSADTVLRKSASTTSTGPFSLFLSHSSQDADAILGVKAYLESAGYTVYVDWIHDPQLDRSRVSAATARQLRARMNQCASLVYVSTPAASSSKWMPWELGYFDGRKTAEAVAILPLVDYQGQPVGQEYLGLYPQLEIIGGSWAVTRRLSTRTEVKSLGDLVAARGGTAWR